MGANERRVLIIEPDDELARIVERFLQSNMFRVARARDIEQGRWMASVVKPQVTLINSDNEDCIEAAKQFRDGEDTEEIPLVIVLEEDFESQNPDLFKSYHEVYDGFLYKPFADTELLRVVENFTGFGASEESVEKALHNIIKENNASPELKSVVNKLQSRKTKGKSDPKDSSGKKIKKLDEELASAREQSKKQAERISDLLNQISDLELDHSFTIENMEAEKDKFITEIGTLNKRIKELENANAEILKMVDTIHKALNKK